MGASKLREEISKEQEALKAKGTREMITTAQSKDSSKTCFSPFA